MLGELYNYLDDMSYEDAVLEITTIDNEVFTGFSLCDDEGEDDMAWCFKDVKGVPYSIIYLKDIATVRKVGESEYAYVAEDYQLAKAI